MGREPVRRIRPIVVREVGVEPAAKPSRVRLEVLTALRVARLNRCFAIPDGDSALVGVLAEHAPAWRESGGGADINAALALVEQHGERTAGATVEHEFVARATSWRRAA